MERRRRRRRDPADRFWEKVVRGDGCWIWTAARDSNGYGRFGIEYRTVLAHRFAFELTYGAVPTGLFVCHRCDNPPCVRPDHLFLGSNAENMYDAAVKQRMPAGERSAVHRLTDEQVRQIRELANSGYTNREIGARFGVHRTYVDQVVHFKLRARAGGPMPVLRRGERDPRAKLTQAQADGIRTAHAAGASALGLAKQYEVSRNVIRSLLEGKTYRVNA